MASSENSGRPNRYTYAQAGVDIDAGNAFVKAIGPLTASTARPGADGGLGGFSGLFDLAKTRFRDPVLVATNDGVGTKLRIAIDCNRHDSIGIDLVAMCVNDLVVQGAEPLFFLDYFATDKLSVDTGQEIIAGISEGCRQAGCALIGGETAEMPGVYNEGDYDLAGFSVGAVERLNLLPRKDVGAGDVLLGLASDGLHSNGFSLLRRLVKDKNLPYDSPCPFDSRRTLGEALLTPTRIYVKPILEAIYKTGGVKGMAHITGGGFVDNIPRILPDEIAAVIDGKTWCLPPVFRWLMELGDITESEMARTFNCGIGMVVIVEDIKAGEVQACLEEQGESVFRIGVLARDTDGQKVVIQKGLGTGA